MEKKKYIPKKNSFANQLRTVITPQNFNGLVNFPTTVSKPQIAQKFTFQDIQSEISNLNTELISNNMLSRVAMRVILFICNAILNLQYFPKEWKKQF